MIPKSPVMIDGRYQEDEIKVAESQDEYLTLPMLYVGEGVMLCRWELDSAEIEKIRETKSVYLYMWTFGRPVTPIHLQVAEPGTTNYSDQEFPQVLGD